MIDRYKTIRNELALYADALKNKKEIVAATKMDACNDEVFFQFDKFAEENNITLFRISSLSRSGTKELIEYVSDMVKAHRKEYEETESDTTEQL